MTRQAILLAMMVSFAMCYFVTYEETQINDWYMYFEQYVETF